MDTRFFSPISPVFRELYPVQGFQVPPGHGFPVPSPVRACQHPEVMPDPCLPQTVQHVPACSRSQRSVHTALHMQCCPHHTCAEIAPRNSESFSQDTGKLHTSVLMTVMVRQNRRVRAYFPQIMAQAHPYGQRMPGTTVHHFQCMLKHRIVVPRTRSGRNSCRWSQFSKPWLKSPALT